MKQKILIVDDEFYGAQVVRVLARKGFVAEHMWRGSDAIRAVDDEPDAWAAAVLNLRLGTVEGKSIDDFMGRPNGGVRILEKLRVKGFRGTAVIMSAWAEDLRLGKPPDLDRFDSLGVVKVIRKQDDGAQALAMELGRVLHADLWAERKRNLEGVLLDELPDLNEQGILDRVRELAYYDKHMLLLGESGVGKEALARYYLLHSGRTGAFVPIPGAIVAGDGMRVTLCGQKAGFPQPTSKRTEGAFDRAGYGVVYIGELDKYMDNAGADLGPLFSATDERYVTLVGGTDRIDVRCAIVASANDKNKIGEAVRSRFEIVEVPPLRERPRDVKVLAKFLRERFLDEHAIYRPKWELTEEQLEALVGHPLPGNIRQLRQWVLSDDGFLDSVSSSLPVPAPPSGLSDPRRLELSIVLIDDRANYGDYFGTEGSLKRAYWTWLVQGLKLNMTQLKRVSGQNARDVQNALRTFGLVAPDDDE